MSVQRLLLYSGVVLIAGCLFPVREKSDLVVADLASHPYDVTPEPLAKPASASAEEKRSDGKSTNKSSAVATGPAADVHTTAMMQAKDGAKPARPRRIDLTIPSAIPGSEAAAIANFPEDQEAAKRETNRIYPELPPLTPDPVALPGPEGQPYTLADLQRMAAANSPTLRQAVADVQAARGNLIQARTYPNPVVGLEQDPNNNNSSTGTIGGFVDQPIKTGGKLRLQGAAAEMDVRNAELALRRARSDLATQVRNAYFGLLVAHESMRVNRALAQFTDEIYRLQRELVPSGFAAAYEPATLRAQAYAARLAHKQAIGSYVYAWKQLVAVIGMHQLPLTEVAGRIDRLIPYFEFDTILAHVRAQHTDVLTARNAIQKARYNLMLAQITPLPDIDVRLAVLKETTQPPFTWVHSLQVGVPFPIWDQNKGNIIAAQSALDRATEEPHRAEVSLTNTLATAYTAYKNNLEALEHYRRYILPDQVRYYRGVFRRREVDLNVGFVDLVQAQQTLATSVTSYLSVLGQLWTSVVNVADLLQTDDLFQMGQPHELPELPDLEALCHWPCQHPAPAAGCSHPTALPQQGVSALPQYQSAPKATSRPKSEPQTQARPPMPAVSSVSNNDPTQPLTPLSPPTEGPTPRKLQPWETAAPPSKTSASQVVPSDGGRSVGP
jgi:cobalt-zinc-cadmium efflux system outer membrane protein